MLMKNNSYILVAISILSIFMGIVYYSYVNTSNSETHSYIGTQENYALSVVKLDISLHDFEIELYKGDKASILSKLDFIFSRLYVINKPSESSVYLFKNNDYKINIDKFTKVLNHLDITIKQQEIIEAHDILDDIYELKKISKLLLNNADNAIVKQRNVNIQAFLSQKKKIEQLFSLTILIFTLTIILFFINFIRHTNILNAKKNDLAAKNIFLGKLGHELRSSLQVIVGTIDLISKEEKHTIERIERLTNTISKIDILMRELTRFIKIDSGQIHFHQKNFKLFQLIEEVIADCKIRLMSPNQKVVIEGEKETVIFHDKAYIYQILENIISNAFKYGEGKNISVRYTLKGKTLLISIKDNGSGISTDNIQKIFYPYYREGKKNVQGVGLGLSIVQGILNSMNGKITVHSIINVGSEFIVKLPLKSKKELNTTESKHITTHKFNLINIDHQINALVIDDEIETLSVIKEMLQTMNIFCDCMLSPIGALRKAKRKPYDIILSDLQMSEMSGIEFFETLKNSKSPNRFTPAIILSASESEVPFEAFKLQKPIQINDLKDALEKTLNIPFIK